MTVIGLWIVAAFMAFAIIAMVCTSPSDRRNINKEDHDV